VVKNYYTKKIYSTGSLEKDVSAFSRKIRFEKKKKKISSRFFLKKREKKGSKKFPEIRNFLATTCSKSKKEFREKMAKTFRLRRNIEHDDTQYNGNLNICLIGYLLISGMIKT
jgi:hypothetical protein